MGKLKINLSRKPKWWWIIAAIGVCITAAGIPLYTHFHGIAIEKDKQQEEIKRQDKQRVEDNAKADAAQQKATQEATPRLRVLSVTGPDSRGLTHIKVKNESTSTSATLHYIALVITDSAQLKKIARVRPKPKEQQAEAPIDHDDGRLRHGAWQGARFVFFVYPDIAIAPDTTTIIDSYIIDAKLPGLTFTGDCALELHDGNGTSTPATMRSFAR